MIKLLKKVSIVLLIILLIIKRPTITTAIIEAINIWITNLFPALFPILILSDLIISTDLINVLIRFIGPLFKKLFKVGPYAAYVFWMSALSGCPSNAKYIKDLLDHNLISKNEAVKTLSMSLLYNPILILTITSYLDKKDSYFIIIANIIINLIIGFINREVICDIKLDKTLIPKKFDLVSSISKTIDTLLLVLGSLVLFIALSSLVPLNHPILDGIFEITNGIKEIEYINNYNHQLMITGILLSFGGLSIQTQIKSILKDYNLEYSLFYKSRIIHLFLFILIIYLKIIIKLP
ncbi:MAG: hypothetical protein PHX04_04905 [Bacilli bacterium]|nr:hypothetical protein [Bacilli bacterium]